MAQTRYISLALVSLVASVATAQAAQTLPTPSDRYRAWVSAGFAASGGHYVDPVGLHAAASVAINRVVLSIGNTGALYSDRGVLTYLVGAETRDPHQFETASLGLAKSYGVHGCNNCETDGLAGDVGIHFAQFIVGIGINAQAVLAERRASSISVSVALEAGWFGK